MRSKMLPSKYSQVNETKERQELEKAFPGLRPEEEQLESSKDTSSQEIDEDDEEDKDEAEDEEEEEEAAEEKGKEKERTAGEHRDAPASVRPSRVKPTPSSTKIGKSPSAQKSGNKKKKQQEVSFDSGVTMTSSYLLSIHKCKRSV